MGVLKEDVAVRPPGLLVVGVGVDWLVKPFAALAASLEALSFQVMFSN